MAKRTNSTGRKHALAKRRASVNTAISRHNAAASYAAKPDDELVRIDPRQVEALRDLFWENVVREMLTALSAMQADQPDLFDGRLGLVTRRGERIGIAEVQPVFACGVPGSAIQQSLSIAVECSVFRVRTPDGEVFTLPLSEVRGLHSLTGELLKELEQNALAESSTPLGQPFGFAAFTSAARQKDAPAKKRGRGKGKTSGS